MNAFWSDCLSHLEQELPEQQFNAWIKTLRVEDETEGQLRLLAPNGFILRWVRDRYLERISDLARTYFAHPINIDLLIDPQQHELAAATGAVDGSNGGDGGAAAAAAADAATAAAAALVAKNNDFYESTRLNADFVFNTLVTGRSNEMARAAATLVADNPGVRYNPLFIYGGVGLGKTHLLHAIGNQALERSPGMNIRYIHAEDYYSSVVRAFQQQSFDSFKQTYRNLDLLLVDDIQFFKGKARSQEEFFYVFNALIGSKKQIVITCDTYPKDIQGMEERLISRFDWGLTVQIEPPELEMRVAILKKKAELDAIDLNDDVAFLIAKNLRSNVRELEGALKKVLAFARFHRRDISLELAREALKDILQAHSRQLTLEFIQKTVADYYKIKVADMYSQKRTRAIARPRQIAMWLSREFTHHSLPEIGEAFGGRDHTTVMYACRTIVTLRAKDNQLNHDLLVLSQTIKA